MAVLIECLAMAYLHTVYGLLCLAQRQTKVTAAASRELGH